MEQEEVGKGRKETLEGSQNENENENESSSPGEVSRNVTSRSCRKVRNKRLHLNLNLSSLEDDTNTSNNLNRRSTGSSNPKLVVDVSNNTGLYSDADDFNMNQTNKWWLPKLQWSSTSSSQDTQNDDKESISSSQVPQTEIPVLPLPQRKKNAFANQPGEEPKCFSEVTLPFTTVAADILEARQQQRDDNQEDNMFQADRGDTECKYIVSTSSFTFRF